MFNALRSVLFELVRAFATATSSLSYKTVIKKSLLHYHYFICTSIFVISYTRLIPFLKHFVIDDVEVLFGSCVSRLQRVCCVWQMTIHMIQKIDRVDSKNNMICYHLDIFDISWFVFAKWHTTLACQFTTLCQHLSLLSLLYLFVVCTALFT